MSYTEKILRQQEKERDHEEVGKTDPSGRKETEPQPVEGEIIGAKSVLVRSSPRKDKSNIITWLSSGSKVRIFGRESGFYKVRVNDLDIFPLYIDDRFVTEFDSNVRR